MAQIKPLNYKGKIIEFPLDNPEEGKIPDEELHEHLVRPTTERTKRLKARVRAKHTAAGEFVEKGVRAGIERMRLLTEAHKANVGKPEVVRRALMLSNLLNKCTVVLQEDEFIIGYHAEDPNLFPLYPELVHGPRGEARRGVVLGEAPHELGDHGEALPRRVLVEERQGAAPLGRLLARRARREVAEEPPPLQIV